MLLLITGYQSTRYLKAILATTWRRRRIHQQYQQQSFCRRRLLHHHHHNHQVFASCLPGLEPILEDELSSLGFVTKTTTTTTTTTEEERKRKSRGGRGSGSGGGGGIEFEISKDKDITKELFRCHLYLGTASHLYLRVGNQFRATGMKELYRKVSKLDLFWKKYLNIIKNDNNNIKFNIRVKATKSRLYHTGGIAERVQKGIEKALGYNKSTTTMTTAMTSPIIIRSNNNNNQDDDDNDDDIDNDNNDCNDDDCDDKNIIINILVRIHKDIVQLSIDTSMTPLHKRGYRLEGSKAPLREDLAYALVYPYCRNNSSSNNNNDHDDDESSFLPAANKKMKIIKVIDPFCGSGTIILEAAALLYGLPPGRLRPPPLVGTKLQNDNEWYKMIQRCVVVIEQQEQKKKQQQQRQQILLVGLDRNQGAIDISKRNSYRAGLSNFVNFQQGSIGTTSSSDWFLPSQEKEEKEEENDDGDSYNNNNNNTNEEVVIVVTNPPFGHRISSTNRSKSSSSTQGKNI